MKRRLLGFQAELDRVLFIRDPSPDRSQTTSLRQLSLLWPRWVIIDTWQHYLRLHGITDTAGAGRQGTLLGEIADLAREFEAAITISHHNQKSASGDAVGAYRDSTAIGATVDMIVAMKSRREGSGATPHAVRTLASGSADHRVGLRRNVPDRTRCGGCGRVLACQSVSTAHGARAAVSAAPRTAGPVAAGAGTGPCARERWPTVREAAVRARRAAGERARRNRAAAGRSRPAERLSPHD